MDYKIALEILDIHNEHFTKKELKKAYYKKCLQHHPDKNNSNGDMFKKCNEAYIFLLNESGNSDHEKDNLNLSYKDIIKRYISLLSNKYGWNNEILNNVFEIFLKDATKISFKLFEAMNAETLLEIYEYVIKFKNLFGIHQNSLDKLREIIKSKYETLKIVNLQPSLKEIMDDLIFVLDNNNKKKYIPLWHNELHFTDCIVYINPIMPSYIEIDEYNNLNIFITMTYSEMFSGEKKKINICEKHDVYIETNNLLCRKYQKYILKGQGLACIQEKDIFDISKRSDIIIHITPSE